MTTSAQTDPLIGRLVDGRYRVRARIARGGMATVYVATDMRLERRVALKVMHSHLTDDAVFQGRFVQEARAAARLADPHVVNVFDQGQDGDMAYLVMEYLPGITLRALIREERRLTVPQAVTILDAVLSGLSAAHRAGIVHRDVKPENVLLAEDGRIKVGDFGLARASTANTASGQLLLGTIAYLAPELVTRGTADARSDIYALGIMLYEMLTGEQPYKGEQPMQIAFQHATDSVPRPSAKNPGVPEPLDELVLWATEREPDDRPADAAVMLHRLREIEDELEIAPQVQRTLAAASAAADRSDADGLTKVLPAHLAAPATGPTDVDDNATRLRRRMRARAAKGGWLFAVVVLLAVLAATTGWWFGSGPGSLVPVPAVAGQSYAQASGALADLGLGSRRHDAFSLQVSAGRVISTSPDAGARVAKHATVSLVISAGPRSHRLPALAGQDRAKVEQTLGDAHVRVADTVTLFTDAPEGTVIAVTYTARDGGNPVDCSKACTVFEGGSARLTVSDGPLPNVSGMSAVDATSQLTDLGLKVTTSQAYSGSVASGDVIGMNARPGGGAWRPGDTVTLVVSRGPQLFPVPNVVGQTLDQAKQTLAQAGFAADYNGIWNDIPSAATKVTSTAPKNGASTCGNGPSTACTKGSTISLFLTLTTPF